jgi:hypothetical protein
LHTAYIAKGELWLQTNDTPAERIESNFAREIVERDATSRRTTSWKSAARDEQSSLIPASRLWGQRGRVTALTPPRFLYVAPSDNKDMLWYVLQVGASTGLFQYFISEKREVRIFHRNDFQCLGLCYNATDKQLVFARVDEDGCAHLEVYDNEGNFKSSVTAGECVDAAPCSAPGKTKIAYCQSAGLGRTAQGGFAGYAPSTINRIDYATGAIDTVLSDARFDFVAPRMDGNGWLYCIRRPVDKPAIDTASNALLDVLLFPWRMIKAIFGYLNFFSMIYGKESLRSSGGPRSPELDEDIGKLWLHGRMIDLSKVRYEDIRTKGLVPSSWELVRLAPNGNLDVMADRVACFDVRPDGSIVFSNGFELSEISGTQRRKLGKAELVELLAAV